MMLSAYRWPVLGTLGMFIIGALPVFGADLGSPGRPTLVDGNPPISQDGGPTHEPSGFGAIATHDFSSSLGPGWSGNHAYVQIVSDGSAPESPTSVGQVTYPAGFGGGFSPPHNPIEANLAKDIANARYKKVYVSFWLKVSSNWHGHNSNMNKIGFIGILGARGNWHNMVVPTLYGRNDDPLKLAVNVQNLEADSIASARNGIPNVNDKEFTRGQWHHVEIVITMNTPGVSNGRMTWWLDGTEVGDYSDVGFVDAGAPAIFTSVIWYPIWGGTGDNVPTQQFMRMDHYYASGAP